MLLFCQKYLLESLYFHNQEDKLMPMYNRRESIRETTPVIFSTQIFYSPLYLYSLLNISMLVEFVEQLLMLMEDLYVDKD